MNTTKHTPGPWRAEKDETAEVWDIRCNFGTVAMTDDLSPKTNEANARLIAAAPAMLEALKRLARVSAVELETARPDVIAQARAAIIQAEGGAQ